MNIQHHTEFFWELKELKEIIPKKFSPSELYDLFHFLIQARCHSIQNSYWDAPRLLTITQPRDVLITLKELLHNIKPTLLVDLSYHKSHQRYSLQRIGYLVTSILYPWKGCQYWRYARGLNDLTSSNLEGFCSGVKIPPQFQYGYISYSRDYFIETILKTRGFSEGERFIDIGCGIGDKVFLTWLISGMNSDGLEFDPITASIAEDVRTCLSKHLSSWDTLQIKIGDAFRFTRFGDYDRIYTYCPIKSHYGTPQEHNGEKDGRPIQRKFYSHIAEQLKSGTMWIEILPGSPFRTVMEKFGFKERESSCGAVYEKE